MCIAHSRDPVQCIIPPFMLERLAESRNASVRKAALRNLQVSAEVRTQRALLANFGAGYLRNTLPRSAGATKLERRVYDQGGRNPPASRLPGTLRRAEGQAATGDAAVDEAYRFAGNTWTFWRKVHGRNSIDDAGMTLVASVHAGVGYDNAFWNGMQMVYGDGDGVVFQRFTRSLDVVAHELTHGVVQYTSTLDYQGESGALNEHFADVFGVLVRQYTRRETAAASDWLIGRELLVAAPTRRAIRNMKEPGTAYANDAFLGSDPQPAHYRNRYKGSDDNGGVHINSGILNRAFALAAIDAGGSAWRTVGPIWYQVMQNLLPSSAFADCAAQLRSVARTQADGKHRLAVERALRTVGL